MLIIKQENSMETKKRKYNDTSFTVGIVLIILGIVLIIDRHFPEISFKDLWPYILIIIGGIMIFRSRKDKN